MELWTFCSILFSIVLSSEVKQSNLPEIAFKKQSGNSDAFLLKSTKLRDPIHVTDESLLEAMGAQCLLFCILIWCRWRRWDGLVFTRSASRKMPSFDKFRVIYHPEGAEIVFVAYETFVKWQIGTYRVLRRLPYLSKEIKSWKKLAGFLQWKPANKRDKRGYVGKKWRKK